mmetsp:Transcript_18338/g.32954  ORF Transcript_18338/g.32954 Transcript_18338/m.32954 type:complete len:222 (-) Transcript_18338:1977-2642(-)
MSSPYRLLEETSELEQADSITQFNLVIKQYNDPINVKEGVILSGAYSDGVYGNWCRALRNAYILVLLAYVAPYLTVVTLCVTIYCLVIHENAMSVYRESRMKVPDVFENMVYNDDLCKNNHYLYFQINVEDLSAFRFSPLVVNELMKREQKGIISFMVYDRVFRNYFEGLHRTRCWLWLHLGLNLTVFSVMQLLVYEPLLCFNLLHPLDSVAKCESEAASG